MTFVGDTMSEGGVASRADAGSGSSTGAGRPFAGGRRRFLQAVGAVAVVGSLAGCVSGSLGTYTASAMGWRELDGFAFRKHLPQTKTSTHSGLTLEVTTQTLAYTSESGIAVGATTMPDVDVAGVSIPDDPAKLTIDEFVRSEYGLALFNGMDVVDERITAIDPVPWRPDDSSWNTVVDRHWYDAATYTEQPQVRAYKVRATGKSGAEYDAWFILTRGKTAKFGENTKGITLIGAGQTVDEDADGDGYDVALETWGVLGPAHGTIRNLSPADLKSL